MNSFRSSFVGYLSECSKRKRIGIVILLGVLSMASLLYMRGSLGWYLYHYPRYLVTGNARRPEAYTGLWKTFDGKGELIREAYYSNGLQHGYYYEVGSGPGGEPLEGVYRHGEPWDGTFFCENSGRGSSAISIMNSGSKIETRIYKRARTKPAYELKRRILHRQSNLEGQQKQEQKQKGPWYTPKQPSGATSPSL